MTCVHCTQHVTEALKSVPGVEIADVPGWQSDRATVHARLRECVDSFSVRGA